MKTFTTYAEKKAKQFFNLLQGYTKGIRFTAILILLLMGVNNAWAASEGSSWYDWANSENVYFDNTNSSYSNVSMLIGRQWNYDSDGVGSSGVNFTKIANTNNLYHAATTWNHYNTLLFMDATGWGWEGNKVTQRYTYASNYTNTNNVNINGTELFYAASSTKGATLNHQDLTSYTALNYTQTVQQHLSTDGGSNYSASTAALATITVSSYQLNSKNTTTSTSGTIASGSSNTTCSAARTATVTYTVTDVKSGYTFVGWYDGTTQKSTSTTYTYNATEAKTITARFKENTYTVTVTNDGHGTTDPSGARSNVGQVTGLDIEASPATNYEFVNWTITSGSGSFGSETSASTTFKPTSAATIQANFRSTATNSLTVVAGANIESVAGSKDPVTLGSTYDIEATPKTGYTFSTWTANPTANATFGNATTANTTVTVHNGSVIVTASATENMSTLTTSNKYDAGDPGYAVPTASVNSIGYETTATVTATAAGNGYTFTGWTLTNCTRTDGGAADATNITVRSNGDSKAAEVVANYAEDCNTTWVLAHSIDGFNTSSHPFVKKSGESTGKVAYVALDLAANTEYTFKVKNGDTWYGNNNSDPQYWIKATVENWTFYSDANDCHMKSSVAGTYTFKIDFSGTNPKVSVQFPIAYKVTYGVGDNKGTDAVSTDPSVSSGSLVLAATPITFIKGTTADGYTWKNWNSTADGSGTILGTGDTYVSSNRTGDISVYACYDLITYNITYNLNGGSGTMTPTSYTITTTTFNLPSPSKTGYTFAGWYENANLTGNKVTQIANGSIGHKEFWAKWTANQYTINYKDQGGSNFSGTHADGHPTTHTYGTETTLKTASKTGYTFGGWFTNQDCTGEPITTLGATDYTAAITLYAKWTAITYTVTLDQTGAETQGTASVPATYDAAMPSATMPTAANGYVFMGYFDGEQGAGTQYYNADGTSAHVWDKAEDATLYAHFAKAEITQITLDQYTFKPVEAGGTGFVTATPTIEPTPTNDVVLCWRLLYNNDNPVAGRDAQVVSGNSVQFSIAGLAAGTYKIEAVLRTGNNCGSGEVLSTKTVNFSIASSYTITVRYTCDGKEIAAPAKVSASVTEETEITAPNITGYTLSSWEAGDGVTIESTNGNSVKITAIYDGYLTAKYTARPMVYFKNTLGWEKVYVYTFNNQVWHNGNNGTGGDSDDMGVQPKSNRKEFGEMTLVEGTDDIYFFELNPTTNYTQDNANENYIAFSDQDMSTYNLFYGTKAVYRGDHKNNLTLFIPQADQKPEIYNGTQYYSTGIWMKYNSTESGYQIPSNLPGGDWNTYTDNFTTTNPGGYTFSITKNLAANTEYEFKIRNYVWIHNDWEDNGNGKDNNQWFGYDGTIQQSVSDLLFHDQNAEKKGYNNTKIKTTAAGEYIFTIDLSQGKVLLSVEYPIEVGDYRVIYKDNATWSKGTAHDANWYHPSRIIKKNKTAEPTKDIISFFISYGQNTTMQFQRVKSITNGNVTWENAGEARIPDAVKEAGVYNFIVTQAANGASISMEDNAEPYTGNYYIRVDALAGKWDNYKTNPENRMTYSAFSESEANSFGEKFSHYATKYCTNGTNIKFTIANDYSPCISDTLVQDVVNPLGNLDSEGTLLSNDMYNANVRFMWYRKTNKISRAYVGPAGDKQSQFLMLRTNVEMQDAAGALDAAEGDIIDAGNSIYAAHFADTQNWIYERTVKVKPGTRVKLYASYPKCYHIYVENNTGWSDIALYAWKDGGDQPLGAWPGLRPARTVEIGGTTYHDFQVNEWVFGSKLKLNNNNNSKETDEFNGIGTAGNYYLTATSSALTTVKYEANVTEANAQYFRGAYDDNNSTWNDNNSVVILGGSGDNWNKIRIIYDFKTNRLMAALVPDQEVSGEKTIAADVMIIRQHQNPATSITLANDASKMTQVKTVYGSLQLNRWVLNNRKSDKSGIEYCTEKINNQDTYSENVTNTHHPVLPTGEQKSIYERALYFISFPFDVHLSDVFGFGTYGTHWVISDYNGLRRAQRGYFAEDCINEDCTNWDYIWDPADFILEANKGYLLSLDLDLMRYDNTDFWLHNIDQVELYFPSTANLATIEKTSYTMPALSEEYLCKINHNTDGTTPDRDRRVKDSYWRCIGVPSFANYDGSLYKSKEDAEANEGEGQYPINWKDDYTWTADESGFPFLYEWNVTDNSLSVQNTSAYQFKPTFAYLVQNGDAIYWKAVNTKPLTPIIARQRTEADRNYEWKIALLRNGNQEDQTFVRITDNENVTTEFDFNQDLAKEFNYGRGDIYTLIGYERVAANSMPCSDKTTIIPLGLNIEQAGDYTIAMPEGVENIGITLVDNETGIHTNLSAGQEYTLTLNNGICENRLFIEVSPIQNTPTDLEYTTGDTREQSVRKVLIDGKLYIVCDGVVYDAQGKRMSDRCAVDHFVVDRHKVAVDK